MISKIVRNILDLKFLFILLLTCLIAVPAFAKKPEKFVVIIDAGHGGSDSGNFDNPNQAYERDITLAIAKKLGEQIKKKIKNCEVKYTREKDVSVPLKSRADYARKMKGNLFISLHINSSKNPDDVGFMAYILDNNGDEEGKAQAIRENSVITREKDSKKNYGEFNPLREDFTSFTPDALNSHYSETFAEKTKQKMAAVGRPSLGVAKGGFWLLSAAGMPGAVLELGFISNAEERKFLMSKEGQEKIALGLCNAVVDYVNYYRTTDVSKINTAPKEEPSLFDSSNGAVLAVAEDYEEKEHNPNTRKRRGQSGKRKRRTKVVCENRSRPTSEDYDWAGGQEEPEEEEMALPVASTVLNNQDSAGTSEAENSAKKKDREERGRVKKQSSKKLYTIQLYTSKELLEENNIAFKGLKPVMMIHENNVYKYTYGESESKQEMEKMLAEVKKRIPDAKIIQIRK